MTSVGLLDETRQKSAPHAFVTPWRVGWLLAAATGLMVALWPLGMAGDYMNHLARNDIEARIWFDPLLQKNYMLSFEVIPDLAMDMIVPWLSYVTGIYAAGAVLVWAAFVMPPLAGLAVAQSLHGRVSWVALLGFLAMFNQNMQWGFVNFTLSTGLALLGFALWIRSAPAWRRTLIFAPFGVVLALSHALGFLLFGYLVLLWEIGCFASGQRSSFGKFIRQLATKDAVAMIPGVLVIALGTGSAGQLEHLGVIDFELAQKVDALWSASSFFSRPLAMLVTITLACMLWLGLWRGVLKMEPRMIWVCAGLLALIIALPTTILGIWGLQFRYQAALVILAAASVEVNPHRRRLVGQVAVFVAVLIVVLFGNAALLMSRIDAMARDNRELLAGVFEGARVLPASHERTNALLTLHAAAMAVIERSAYVPNLFTNTSPVGVRPEVLKLHMPQSRPLFESELAEAAELELPQAVNGHWSPDYYYGWPDHWDYIVYFRTLPEQSLSVPFLCRVAETASAVLYRISRGECHAKDGLDGAAPATPAS